MVGNPLSPMITDWGENLRNSALKGDLEGVKKYTTHKSINSTDEDGYSALQRASSEGHVEIVKYLLQNGANVDNQDKLHGNTPLHEAAWKGHSQTCECLVKSKANVYIRNKGGFAPLHLSCQKGHNQSCRVILLAGCKPDIKNNYGDTSLHTASRYGHAGVTRIVLSARANPSEINKNGDTPLHIAAAMGRRKLTRILLEAGSDQRIQNKQLETPLSIATRKEHGEVIEILRNPPPMVTPEERMKREIDETQKKHQSSKKRDKNVDSGNSSKESGSHHKEKKHKKDIKLDPKLKTSRLSSWGVEWSPYGCHSSHANSQLKDPKLDTLPDNPLESGEQYFVDLAGNIRKGPMGISTGCYCAPLFKSVHNKMEKDKLDLIDHIDAANSKLGNRISSLEVNTKSHIKKLGDTVQQQLNTARNECRERSEIVEEITTSNIDRKVEHLKDWITRRPAFAQADYRRRPMYSRRSSLEQCSDVIHNGLTRSKSEEAISEIYNPADRQEPVYKGLRVLDHPTSMHDLKNKTDNEPDNLIYSNINGGTMRRRRLSDGDAGSCFQCTVKPPQEDVRWSQSNDIPRTNGNHNYQTYLHTSYPNQPPYNTNQINAKELSGAVQNLNIRGSTEPSRNPHLVVTNGISHGRYTVNPPSNPPLQQSDQPLVNYVSTVTAVPATAYHTAPMPNIRSTTDVNGDAVFSIEDTEAPMYIDMNRHLSPLREELPNQSHVNGHTEVERLNGVQIPKIVLESSTEHDSHNDSGYSTRICGGSQGPSPPLPGVPDGHPVFRYPPPYRGPHNPLMTRPPLPPYKPPRFGGPIRSNGHVNNISNPTSNMYRPLAPYPKSILTVRSPSLV